MSSNSVQPADSKNPDTLQTASVENQSVGQFEDWVVVGKSDVCIKGLPEKVSGGFSLGRSIGCIWHAVKEGISAFFQRLFGKKSEAPTDSSGVEVSTMSAKRDPSFVGSQPPPDVTASGSQFNVSYKSTVSPNSTVPQESAPRNENGQNVSVGSSQTESFTSNSSKISELNTSKVSNETVFETSSAQATASVKKNVSSPLPGYKLVDVPGDGNCGVWAVLAGMGAIKLSECIRPQHGDYGGRPIATDGQKKIMINLRKRAEQEALKAVQTNPSAAGCAARLGLRDKSPTLETVDFQYIVQAIGRPIVVSQYQGNVEVYRTICDPNETEPTSLFLEDFNDQQLRQGNPIRLYFDGGHYQLMQPIKTS